MTKPNMPVHSKPRPNRIMLTVGFLLIGYGFGYRMGRTSAPGIVVVKPEVQVCISDKLPLYAFFLILVGFSGCELLGLLLLNSINGIPHRLFRTGVGVLLILIGFCGHLSVGGAVALNNPLFWLPKSFRDRYDPYSNGKCREAKSHSGDTVTQKLLTMPYFCNTLIAIGRAQMANVLSFDKQVAIVSALAEGSAIRQIERMTGVHRDTIMRLGVRVGHGCAALLDARMRDLDCENLQFDELWGFIGKKQKHVQAEDDPTCGDVWTFCAIDSDTKLVPSFKVGKRDSATANAFVRDVASRLKNRVQISTDGLLVYVEAVERAFGANVDYAQIVKVFDDQSMDAEVIGMDKRAFTGRPNMALASTSHVERLNGTTRLHMRRLTRLTYAFSKKLENFEAAVALHFAYYNLVKRHNTLRCTPAMAAGIERDFWTVGNLLEATV